VKSSDPDGPPLNMYAISPKRNAEMRAIQQVMDMYRQQNRSLQNIKTERFNGQIQDRGFQNYPTLVELFYLTYLDLCKEGGSQREKMEQLTEEYNLVIQSIFEGYKLSSEWNVSSGAPDLWLMKKGRLVPIEALSLGEQEIISLIINLYSSKDAHDVYLIDEPEIHLNWHLEEKLFEHMDQFCRVYGKQIIVVTHSRAVFKAKFLNKTQFLYWNGEGKVMWGRELTYEQRTKIAGEAINILRMGDFPHPVIYVEDSAHRQVIERLAKALDAEITVQECGNSANVKSLFKLSKSENWKNAYFLVDGDNEGNPFPNESRFFHLDNYCMDNYLLDPAVAAAVFGIPEEAVLDKIFTAIKANREKILKKNKFLDFLFDSLSASDITRSRLQKLDASELMQSYLDSSGLSYELYVNEYVKICAEMEWLEEIFPVEVVRFLRSTKRTTDPQADHT